MKSERIRRLTSAFALTLGLQAPLFAQATAPGTAPKENTAEETVLLPTFTVSTDSDVGYVAVDSLAGGRMNTPIRVTPSAMSSITAEFINDLGLTNLQDSLKWSLNTVPTSDRSGFSGGSGGGVFNFWSISTRGGQSEQGGNPPTKNYFPMFVIKDTYDVDRIEFDQGPNSILFGIGDIGGAVSSYTKTARFDKTFRKVDLRLDTYGGYRATIDANQSFGDLALRFNAVTAEEDGWRDGDKHKKLGANLAADWRFNQKQSHLRLELEGWKEEKTIYGASYEDNTSLWNGTTSAATWGAAIPNVGANPLTTPGAPGVQGISEWGLSPNYNVLIAGSNTGVMNWAGGVRSMGTRNIGPGAFLRPESYKYNLTGGTTIMALPNREFAVAPKDAYVKPEDVNVTLTYEQRINENMDFVVSGYRYVDKASTVNFEGANTAAYDLNRQLPNGSTNPNFGKLFSDFFLGKQVQNHRVGELRGQFSYHFDSTVMNVPLKQVFSASAGQQATNYDARQYNAQDTTKNPADWNIDWTRNMVWGRLYWDNAQASLNLPATVKYTAMPFNWYDFDSKQTIKYGGVFSQSRLWDDRLNITLGVRRDTFDTRKVGLRGPTNPPVLSSGAGNTYSAGVVGYVTEWLGVLANLSKNFSPAAGGLAPTLYGETITASEAKGQNYGLRVSTKDHKYYASLTWYKQNGESLIGGNTPGFQGIWDQYFKAGGTKTNIGPAGQVTGTPPNLKAAMQFVDTYDAEYKGVEFDVTANPTKNIRVVARYAAPKGERTNNGPNGARYFAEHLADWQAAANGVSPDAQKLASDLNTAKNDLAKWAVPTLAGAVVKRQWNIFATYRFTEDTLKGLDVGFGATHTGARQIDQINRTTAYTTESLLLGYSRTFGMAGRDIPTRIQLNVDNLFGNDTLVFQNYEGTQARDYNFIAPRKTTLSVRFEF